MHFKYEKDDLKGFKLLPKYEKNARIVTINDFF